MADQICYSVLCVFSYVAAGQDNKKNPVVITEQIQELHTLQLQQQKSSPSSLVLAQKTTQSQPLPQQPVSKLTTVAVTVHSKPTITTTTRPSHLPSTRSTTHSPAKVTVTTAIESSSAVAPLPKVPPRIPSQNSTEGSPPSKPRGPPPAIPPRTAPISRCESVQVPQTSRKAFQRQVSVNSITPQYKPQPPPQFVIPQRRSSMSRQNTYSSPSTPHSAPIDNMEAYGGDKGVGSTFGNRKH